MDINVLISILLGLFLTLIIETPFYFFFLKIKKYGGILFLFLLNLISNLTMNLINIYLFSFSDLFIYLYEIIIPLIEGLIMSFYIYKIDNKVSHLWLNKRTFLTVIYIIFISYLTNFISFIIGYLFNNYLYDYSSYLLYLALYILIFIIELIIFILFLYFKKKNNK